MESFIFAVGAVMPLILMVSLGYFLKRIGFIKPDFAVVANKLVFRVLLPAMLFLNVYKIEATEDISFGYVIYTLCAVLTVFALVLIASRYLTKNPARRGVLLQGSFRSNFALIGIALASSLFGERGVAASAVLSAVVIPSFNALAVISLSIFSLGKEKPSFKKILVATAKNPLIISALVGLFCLLVRSAFVEWGIEFRLSDVTPVFRVLEYLSSASTPIALIVLGVQFEFSAISEMKREIISGVVLRCAIVPVLAIGCAYVFFGDIFRPEHFAALIAAFATPVAVSSVPMSQEMNGDAALAGQLVVWTTVFSAVTLIGICYFFRAVGVF